MSRLVEIDKADFPGFESMELGAKVFLNIVGHVIDSDNNRVIVEMRSISGGRSGKTGRHDELMAIQKRILREVQQFPKVAPLGHTGNL